MTAFSLTSVFVFTHTSKTQVTLKKEINNNLSPSMRYQMAKLKPTCFHFLEITLAEASFSAQCTYTSCKNQFFRKVLS